VGFLPDPVDLTEKKKRAGQKQLPQGHPHAVPVWERKKHLPREAKTEAEFTTSYDLGSEEILQLQGTGHREEAKWFAIMPAKERLKEIRAAIADGL